MYYLMVFTTDKWFGIKLNKCYTPLRYILWTKNLFKYSFVCRKLEQRTNCLLHKISFEGTPYNTTKQCSPTKFRRWLLKRPKHIEQSFQVLWQIPIASNNKLQDFFLSLPSASFVSVSYLLILYCESVGANKRNRSEGCKAYLTFCK